jgi:hypothetical protein
MVGRFASGSFTLVILLECKSIEFQQHGFKLMLMFGHVHWMPVKNEIVSTKEMCAGACVAVVLLLREIEPL